jgi:hypothetical protein
MTLSAATVSPSAAAPIESEVSLARLYVLRAMYLLLVIGGAIVFLPQLIGHELTARGVIPSCSADCGCLHVSGFATRCRCFRYFSSSWCGRQSGSSMTGYRNGGRACTPRNSQRISKRSRWA